MNLPLAHIWQQARVPSRHLVVVLHGRGDSSEGFTWLQEALSIDSLNFLLLDAPERYYTGFSWYDLPPNQLPGILRSRKLLKDVFAETQLNGYPAEQTFLFGFSQGCLLTLEFGARHSQRLAGYVGISGYTHDTEALLRDLNPAVNQGDWLITHGLWDEMLPVEATREQVRILADRGFRLDYREYAKAHTVDFERELPDIRTWILARMLS
jgi:phospholipase/carboxylesterase